MKRFGAFALVQLLLLAAASPACAATLGPAGSYAQLLALAGQAGENDVLTVSGELIAEGVFEPGVSLTLSSEKGERAAIHGLHLSNASVRMDDISLTGTLSVEGTSFIELGSGVTIEGAAGDSGLSFKGNGTLIIEAGCEITGGDNGPGLTLHHDGGDLYVSLEGVVRGGSGSTGGPGVVVSPLEDAGAMMISGSVYGGDGVAMGGHALNLFELSGNAYVTVNGSIQGGRGRVGGDGIQLVSTGDQVNVGISGSISGGEGSEYGGDALILMNASGASAISLSGSLIGGSVTSEQGQPGTALLIVGESTAVHARVEDCFLEDGQRLTAPVQDTPVPEITPLPEITSSVEDVAQLNTPTPPAEAGATAWPTPESTPEQTPVPTPTPTPEPTSEPTPDSTPEQTPAPSAESAMPDETAAAAVSETGTVSEP